MTRESCIAHPPQQLLAIIRQDYYLLTGRDTCAAALLNIFEYWANAAIAHDPTLERPWLGERPIREFEQMLLGIATDKQIRKRLLWLEEKRVYPKPERLLNAVRLKPTDCNSLSYRQPSLAKQPRQNKRWGQTTEHPSVK